MKNSTITIALIITAFICIGLIAWGIQMKSPIQTSMEKELTSHIDAKSFSNYTCLSETTLMDEVKDSLNYYRMKSSWDKSFLDLYQNIYPNPSKVSYYTNEVNKDEKMTKYLNDIQVNHPELWGESSVKTYRMSYIYVDEGGNVQIEIFDARFNTDGKMVAYKLNSKANWVTIIGHTALPDYPAL